MVVSVIMFNVHNWKGGIYELGNVWLCRCIKRPQLMQAGREEVLTNNIANVDTPNYKRQDVEFTTYLKSALSRSGGDSTSLTNRVNNINYNDVTMRTYTDNSTLSYRLDGNNVDLSTENVELASEQLNYNGLIDSMNNEFTRFKAVLK